MSQSYATEEQVAVSAVRRACQLTSSVFNTLLKGETITKDDKSPVTSQFSYIHSYIKPMNSFNVLQSQITPHRP
jgi:3'-phosphoadenosine 5'-phosphosulfate (PAPS) 3'-phosphatase